MVKFNTRYWVGTAFLLAALGLIVFIALWVLSPAH